MGFAVVNGYGYVVLPWVMRYFAVLWWAMIVVGGGAIGKKIFKK